MITMAPRHEVGWSQSGAISRLISAEEAAQPLLDPKALDKLREDVDGFEVWSAFVQNFLTALPLRIQTLSLTLTTGDVAGALDAVLSLKAASQMVGASRLATLAHGLEMAQREGVRVANPSVVLPRLAVTHLQRIKQRAQQTSYVLEAHLDAGGHPQPMRTRPVGAPDGLLGIP
jgi:HPt (histidine-containing phosphotransfer) domain-containing protein